MNRLKATVRRHPVTAYAALALSRLIEIRLALVRQGLLAVPLPYAAHYLAAYGPADAAITLTAPLDGRAGLRDLFARAVGWRIGTGWLLVAVGSPVRLPRPNRDRILDRWHRPHTGPGIGRQGPSGVACTSGA